MSPKSVPEKKTKQAPAPKRRALSSPKSLREVFGYLRRYRGQIFVIKLDDVLMEWALFPLLVRDIVLLHQIGVRIVLIPGAKNSIDKILQTYGVASKTEGGIRITSEKAMPLVKLGASNVTNALLSLLAENEAEGVVGNWVRARAVGVIKGLDYQHTGRVQKVNQNLIRNLLDDGLIPIVPNIGWNEIGRDYNLNSSELAVAVASALKASKLFFLGKDHGIPVREGIGFAEPGELESGWFSNLDPEEAEILMDRYGDSFTDSQREYLELALEALKGGVERVHILAGNRDGVLLEEVFSSSGQGTMVYHDEFDNLRAASPTDIPEILRIQQPYVDAGILVQRNAETVADDLECYSVYQVDSTLHGCGAIRMYPKGEVELFALAVDTHHAGRGTGRRIVNYLVDRAREMGAKRIFLLTTQTSDFFMRLGFEESSAESLPPIRKKEFNRVRNSRVLVLPIQSKGKTKSGGTSAIRGRERQG